jgi:hypothetical protein
VLVEEKRDKSTGAYCGFSRNYLPVTLYGGAVNQELTVRLESAESGKLFGDLVPVARGPLGEAAAFLSRRDRDEDEPI